MTNEERQAQLLDDYLTLLQRNPDAPAPDGLDPEMADFARMMVGDKTTLSGDLPAQQRVWNDIQSSDIPSRRERTILESDRGSDPHMAKLKEKNKRNGRTHGWLPLVATAAVSVLVSLFLASVLFTSQDREARNTADAIEETAEQAATTLVFTATPTVIPPTALPPSNIDPFRLTATAIVQQATAMVASPTFTPTPITGAQAQADERLTCNFEDEFDFNISQNLITNNDTLIITWRSYNSRARRTDIEIFGGFLTNDEFQLLESFAGNAADEGLATALPELFSMQIAGESYENGSYLIGIRLRDSNLDTLSSCALPVTFVD